MVNSLLLATIVRVALIVLSYGCKVPCGIFVPSMAAGATFGRMIGILVKAMQAYVFFRGLLSANAYIAPIQQHLGLLLVSQTRHASHLGLMLFLERLRPWGMV